MGGCLDCPDAGIAVLLAGLTRALVATALAEARQGTPPPAAPARWVDASLTAAARNGLNGPGVDPFTGQAADARALLSSLLGHVQAALSERGDAGRITTLVHRLDHLGTRGRPPASLFAAAASAPAFAQAPARATLSGGGHQPSARSGRPPGRVAARTGSGIGWKTCWAGRRSRVHGRIASRWRAS